MPISTTAPVTVLDALVQSLRRCGEYNRNDQVPPTAILWPDQDEQWVRLIPKLQEAMPELMVYGDYDLENKRGPAIWLKCMIARKLPEADWPDASIPVIYMPGVGRQQLRAAETCPKLLQPLIELQFRGTYFSQVSSRDWTILAFLTSDRGGLGLDVARDNATQEAMLLAIEKLSETPISRLKNRKLESGVFFEMNNPDPIRDLLSYMDDPEGAKSTWDENAWKSFCKIAKKEYSLDPNTEGELVAAERLGRGTGKWEEIWRRYEEAPTLYQNIPELLRRAKPAETSDLFAGVSHWPQDNDEMESQLRADLLKLKDFSIPEIIGRVKELEFQHAARRDSVWAKLDKAPLSFGIRWLSELATYTEKPLTGYAPEAIASQYVESGWRADAAAIKAIASVERSEDIEAVKVVLRSIYKRWIEDSAEKLQDLIKNNPLPDCSTLKIPEKSDSGKIVMFADGLRYDIAMMLREFLYQKGFEVDIGWKWSTLPTVTASAKPAFSPVAKKVKGSVAAQDFRPVIDDSEKNLTHDSFRRLLEEQNIQVLSANDLGDLQTDAWTEIGSIDKTGHQMGYKLARHIDEEIRTIVHRIQSLMEYGWSTVEIVTDHGWLLMPAGFDKAEMQGFLVEERWGRCARPKEGVETQYPRVKWYWNPDIELIVAPGGKCFKANMEYAHGGVSVQECVVPVITVTSGKAITPKSEITSIRWVGLRCRVEIKNAPEESKAVLRQKVNVPESEICDPNAIVDETASLVVEDDSLIGEAVILVAVSKDGTVLAKAPTVVGE